LVQQTVLLELLSQSLLIEPFFFHMITVTNKNKFLLPMYLAHKIIGIPTPNLSDIIIHQIRT